ncbi:hypothetical protein [Vibrio sp. F74]|uniref:hypothetical protein n=1 Tax=Vibrio sp. F74 TaxID=700020 RepID=UPI0035F5929B
MNKVLKLSITDFKIIFRDKSLKGMLLLPIFLFVLIVWGVPALVERYDFLVTYLNLFLIIAVIENTQAFSFISTMVLIDEKENDVAKVYGVVPLSKFEYIVSRFLIPYLITLLLNVVLFMVQPFFDIEFSDNVLISMLAALVVPVYALSINSIAQNRMQGMIYIKAFNMLVLLPVCAFFVPEKLKHLFGIFPTHWIFQSVENATQGLPIGFMLTIGFIIFTGMFIYVSRSFIKNHFV